MIDSQNIIIQEGPTDRFKKLLENKTKDISFNEHENNIFLKGGSSPLVLSFYHPSSVELFCLWYNPPEYFRRIGIGMHPNMLMNISLNGYLDDEVVYETFVLVQIYKWNCFENT